MDIDPSISLDQHNGSTVVGLYMYLGARCVENDRKNFILGLGVTVLLGAAFTGGQIYEYDHATFGFKDGIYSSTFYMATGFHGFHVLVGTCFWLSVGLGEGRALQPGASLWI